MKKRLERQRELTSRLNVYHDEYYNKNAPSVSDAVYDRLFDEQGNGKNTRSCQIYRRC